MYRLLALLLLVLLPMQMSWALMAGYCGHESGISADHVGHHDRDVHDHDPLLPDSPDASDSSQDAPASLGHDCGHCHGLYAGMMMAVEPLQLDRLPGASVPTLDESVAGQAAARPSMGPPP